MIGHAMAARLTCGKQAASIAGSLGMLLVVRSAYRFALRSISYNCCRLRFCRFFDLTSNDSFGILPGMRAYGVVRVALSPYRASPRPSHAGMLPRRVRERKLRSSFGIIVYDAQPGLWDDDGVVGPVVDWEVLDIGIAGVDDGE